MLMEQTSYKSLQKSSTRIRPLSRLSPKLGEVIILALIYLACIVLGLLHLQYEIHLIGVCCIFSLLAMSVNIVAGFMGQASLGHGAIFGVGAYTSALLATELGVPFWLSLPASAAMGSIFGAIMGVPSLRLSGPYLAMLTIGFGELVRLSLINLPSITKGWIGVYNIPRPEIFGFQLTADVLYLLLIVTITIIFYLLIRNLYYSRIGRMMVAIRESELAANSLGIDVRKSKVTVFAISGFIAGIAGCLYAHLITYINPINYSFDTSVTILAMAIIGGLGSLYGPVIGAFLLTILSQYLLQAYPLWRMFLYGASIIFVVVFAPKGIAGAIDGIVRRICLRFVPSYSTARD